MSLSSRESRFGKGRWQGFTHAAKGAGMRVSLLQSKPLEVKRGCAGQVIETDTLPETTRLPHASYKYELLATGNNVGRFWPKATRPKPRLPAQTVLGRN